MDFDIFKAIIKEASGFGNRSFSLHLFGEPLLYPKLFDAISYIKRSRRSHTVLLTTNGTLLNEKVKELIASGPDLVLWSWKKEVEFSDETRRLLRGWGRFRVRFIEGVTPPEAYKEWEKWPNVEKRRLHNYGGNISLPNKEKGARWSCYHLWLAPAIAWNGNFLLCCADPHQREVLGHFPESSIASMWQGKKLRDIRQNQRMGQYEGICKDCDVWKEYPNMFF